MARLLARAATAIALTGLAIAASPSAAQATPVAQGTESYGDTFEIADYCDVPGLDVQISYAGVSSWTATAGKDGLVHATNHDSGTTVYTNLATGAFVEENWTTNNRDLKVTDNGDGTITVLWLGAGSDKITDADGRLLASNPGQSRFESVIDDNGTPADPFDDGDELSVQRVFGSTGRTDAMGCEQFVDWLS